MVKTKKSYSNEHDYKQRASVDEKLSKKDSEYLAGLSRAHGFVVDPRDLRKILKKSQFDFLVEQIATFQELKRIFGLSRATHNLSKAVSQVPPQKACRYP